jgi:acetyl esterase/lipase
MTNFRLHTSVLVAAVAFSSIRLAQAESRIEENVIYGMYSGLALLMDIHHPDEPNGHGILVIPGSGWHMPTDLDVAPLKAGISRTIFPSDDLLDAGYTLFSINHRAAPRFRYPAAVDDAQRAVRFIRYHADDYLIDPDHIGAIGGSSGGHLVSMLGVMDGEGDPGDGSPINRESSKVQAVVAIFSPADFVAFVRGSGGDKATVGSFLGVNLVGDNAVTRRLYEEASRRSHISGDDPPFLLIHGDADPVVPLEQSELFREDLEHAGVPVEVRVIPGGGHGAALMNGSLASEAIDYMVSWLDSNLVR